MQTQVDVVHDALTLHRVLDPDYTALLRVLSTLSGSRDARKFPGSNPCSLERADFPKLKQQPYFMAEKTNGIRFLLFCCTYKELNVCCIVDRAMSMFLLPLQAVPTALFEGSVIDCELAFNKVEKQWQLLIFDAYVVSSIPVFHKPFSERMAAMQRAMVPYEYRVDDIVPLKVKSFLPTSMIHSYKEHETNARKYFDVDGVILTPELSHATIGRHTELFKLKTKHTIDFLVGANGVDLLVFDPSNRAHSVAARLREPAPPGTITECVRAEDGMWDVVCRRQDKSTANDKLTFQRTLVNMREGIDFDELVSVFV